MKTSNTLVRLFGIIGIVGGMLLFAGDMLFYFDSESVNLKLNMGNSSDFRIKINGIIALLASWFYLLGLVQVYYAFGPAKVFARNIVIASFAAILISYGVIHGAYIAIAVASKIAVQHNMDIDNITALATEANFLMRIIIYPIFAVLSYFFITQVWKRQTYYPRWIIAFFPLVPFLFQGLLKNLLTGSLWVIFVGGFLNLIIVMFFIASTIALWNIERK